MIKRTVSRRHFMNRSMAASAAATFAAAHSWGATAPSAEILSTRIISPESGRYCGWPTVAKRASGELLVVCSGGRDAHVCPFGQVELIRSRDQGKTWSWPQVLLDGPIDDRDAGVLETAKGALLVTSFSSLAYEPILARAEKIKAGQKGAWPAQRLKKWQAAHHHVEAEDRRKALGVWMVRSTDGGVTWSGRYDCLVNSPHGPIQLSDGRLLYAGKDLWRKPYRVGACISFDDGVSWRWLAAIPPRDGDDTKHYHELHGVEAGSGRLVVQIRNHNNANRGETLQCESTDGGKTWSRPHGIGVWGLPSHLLRLSDGRLLMTYGHRRPPFGNQARVSEDEGRTWSAPILVSRDGMGGDLGYPSTVALSDGTLLSVWYERMKTSPLAVLRQAHWRLA